MKQYLLLLRSADFNKSNNIWTSNPFNLYSNDQFNNYSYTRSANGLNLIGDRTFVGTEITSPSFDNLDELSSIHPNSIYKTDLGEVVYSSATPSVKRFIDMSSRIDILSYRYTFTNLSGSYTPTFNITFYEADSENGPWLTSSISSDTGIVFIRNSKPYIKIDLEIADDGIDLSYIGLVFFLEIGIHDPVSPVASKTVKNVLRRFPTWTSVWEDSEDSATPSLDIPESVGGKFLTALMQDGLDRFDSEIIINDINSYISSANEDMNAWLFVANSVPQNINTIYGDGIELARVSNFNELLRGRSTDYSFYYNPVDRTLFTLRSFQNLVVNQSFYQQEAINVFNQFDEFGARVALPRLYLESNLNYKKRILDVTQNVSGVSLEAFKRTLRRELDIWRVYGATPDSNYLGATPEVLDIYDIENSTPYFSESGIPQKEFKTFVEDLNKKYPSNWGYVKWQEGVWDYAGVGNEGVSRIPAIYDTTTPLGNLYQDGVGDFDDALASIQPMEHATVSFEGSVSISGFRETNEIEIFTPVLVPYSWYVGYEATIADSIANRVKAGLVYEISTKAHGSLATPSTFYANLNHLNRADFSVTNQYISNSWATPEFNLINIFNNDGFTVGDIIFNNKTSGTPYYNESLVNKHNINFDNITSIRVVVGKQWDPITQTYSTVTEIEEFDIALNKSPVSFITGATPGYIISSSSPNMNFHEESILIASPKHVKKQQMFTSNVNSGQIILNATNASDDTGITDAQINISNMVSRTIFAHANATPKYIYINGVLQDGVNLFGQSESSSLIGGKTIHPISDEVYLVPSSPNIIFTRQNEYGIDIGTPSYFDHATISYSATPYQLNVSAATGNYYPLTQMLYEYFEASTTPNLYNGFIDETDNVFKSEEEYNNSLNIMDRYLETVDINQESFGFNSSGIKYNIDYIKLNTTPNYIDSYLLDTDSVMIELSNAVSDGLTVKVDIYAEKDEVRENQYNIGIHSGNIYVGENEYYIYVEPITVESFGRLFELDLPSAPRGGAPILANLNSEQLRYLAFEDSATPGQLSFINTEYVTGRKGNSLYLAYEDVSDITVKDTHTGITLFSGLSTETNQIMPFSAATPAVLDREYEVSYYVNNAFFVEKNVINIDENEYISKAYFSSTPDVDSNYILIYEGSESSKTVNSELDLSLTNLPINEGFIYISNDDFLFDRTELYLSPSAISDSYDDLMYLSITSYDENENFKPGQTFRIYGSEITPENEYVTTNANGHAVVLLRYTGSIPATNLTSTIYVEGIGSATPNGGINSSSEGHINSVDFEITRNIKFDLKIRATASVLNVAADSTSKISVIGNVLWKGKPFTHSIPLKWRRARTLHDLFTSATIEYGQYSNSENGKFEIDGFVAQSSINPGIWLCAVEMDITKEEIQSMLLLDGETVSLDDITITGDIVYWNEKYDNIHYVNESLTLPASILHVKQSGSDMIATPNFMYSHNDSSNIVRSYATPQWEIPTWVPLRKLEQYQLGIFGSTPNLITDFSNIHPDSGEE